MRRVLLLIGLAFVAGCGRQPADAPPSRREIWEAIQPLATRYRMEPVFIYALVAAESNFDPKARHDDARGLLQIKPAAWSVVSDAPYEPTVWDWRANLEAGIGYLAHTRGVLHRRGAFSYPLLLAGFHYGLDYLEARDFDLARVPIPPHEIYRQLWRGNLAPVPPPG